MILTIAGAAFIALILISLGHEFIALSTARRSSGGKDDPMLIARIHRRILGILHLALATAIVALDPIVSPTIGSPYLRLFWFGMAFVCIMMALVAAVREVGDIGRMAHEETSRVLEQSLIDIQDEIARAKREMKAEEEAVTPKPRRGAGRRKRSKP